MSVMLHVAPPYNPHSSIEKDSYRHVVGLSFEDVELWRADHGRYGSTAEEYLETPELGFDLRLVEFFKAYLIHRNRERLDYNCHLFAGVISNMVELDVASNNKTFYQAGDIARGIVDQGRLTPNNLALGQHGVLGERRSRSVHQIAHSVIGLGEDRDEFLEVNHMHGNLGIQQYSRSVPYYSEIFDTDGVYSMPGGVRPKPLRRS